MKVADNLHRHNVLYKFEFRQDCTIHFGVTCPLMKKKKKKKKKKKSNSTLSGAYIAYVIFIQSLWNVQINGTGINIRHVEN